MGIAGLCVGQLPALELKDTLTAGTPCLCCLQKVEPSAEGSDFCGDLGVL
jgi:hypothetical protein